jgi:hypothetical protein
MLLTYLLPAGLMLRFGLSKPVVAQAVGDEALKSVRSSGAANF